MVSEPALIVRLHPGLADLYAAKVARLEEVLNDPKVRNEANGLLRSLIERVELSPGGEGQPMQAVLHGDLARIIAFCEGAADNKKRPAADAGGVSCTSVVAGAGFEPATFRL